MPTATAALELMGADERFVTKVAVKGDDLARVRDGVLHGDVYLVGGGDPVLATRGYMSRLWGERPFTDAGRLAASIFDDLLEARGLVIRHRPRAGTAPSGDDRIELASVSSPTLGSIVVRIGAYSENTAAEMLLKEIGYRTEGTARAQAVAGAQAVLSDVLGTAAAEIVMADGSGLSVHNRMSCRAAAALLERPRSGDPLLEDLALAGSTGSLAGCGPAWAGSAEENSVRAKGGLLNDVVAVAGRADAPSGHQLSFAVISNAPLLIGRGTCPALRRIPITAAARFTYGPAKLDCFDLTMGTTGRADAPHGALSLTGASCRAVGS